MGEPTERFSHVDAVRSVLSVRYFLIAVRVWALCVVLAAVVHPSWWLLTLASVVFVALAYFLHCGGVISRRALKGASWLRRHEPESPGPPTWPGVSLLVSAYNEDDAVEAAARSWVALDYGSLEIIAVNDHSTDRTGDILDRIAQESPRLRVIHNPPRRPGWFGKSNALLLAAHETPPGNEWLILTDADVVFAPETVRRAVAHAERHGLDFLCCLPWLETRSLPEELILPLGWCSMAAAFGGRDLNRPEVSAIGLGAFNMVRRRAYVESGGHAVAQGAHPEDQLLAATIKDWGGRMGFAIATDLLRIRMYRGGRAVREAAVRKLRILGSDRIAFVAPRMLGELLYYILPLPLACAAVARQVMAGNFSPGLTAYAACGLLTYVAASRLYACCARVSEMRHLMAWFHPAASLLRLSYQVQAMWQILLRRNLERQGWGPAWKGRPAQDQEHST